MATAVINPPSGTAQGDFTVGITLDVAVSDFTVNTLSVTAVSGNGITGVTFEILPEDDMDAATYNVMFYLPEDVSGVLEIDITGMVTPEGSSTPEAVTVTAVQVMYNTVTNVTATFGDHPVYKENGEISVSITFGEPVIASKTIFRVSHVSGDDLVGMDYILLGEGTAYELVFFVPADRSGEFRISADGNAFLTGSRIWDNVVATPKTVRYSTIIPRIKTYDIPDSYTASEIFDVIIQLDTDATISPAPTGGTFLDHFIFEGADLGTPNLYRKTDDVYPTLPIADFPVGGNADWTQTDMTTEEATIYLLRWNPVTGNPEGIFNLTIRPGAFRGPVS